MNVEIGAEAALFPEKEYISGIFVTLHECRNEDWGLAIPFPRIFVSNLGYCVFAVYSITYGMGVPACFFKVKSIFLLVFSGSESPPVAPRDPCG